MHNAWIEFYHVFSRARSDSFSRRTRGAKSLRQSLVLVMILLRFWYILCYILSLSFPTLFMNLHFIVIVKEITAWWNGYYGDSAGCRYDGRSTYRTPEPGKFLNIVLTCKI
jgi:fatty acid desaturase